MYKFVAVFTRSDTLAFLPSETIYLREVIGGRLMEAVERRRSKISKKIGREALFAAVANEFGQILGYNAHNF